MNIEIRRPQIEDREQLQQFFQYTITDTYIKEGIEHLKEDLKNEIHSKMVLLEEDFNSNGEKYYLLIAFDGETIVGTIGYGYSNDLVNETTNDEFRKTIEIGTVYVHPEYQRKGIGKLLFSKILQELKVKGIEEFCLDSGYRLAQAYWRQKLGDPDYLLKDFWGEGSNYMIWRRKVKDV